MTEEQKTKNHYKMLNNSSNKALVDLIKMQDNEIEQLRKQNKELQEENAELKEKLKPENCLKLLAKEGYIKFTSDNLTKAKEIIKSLCEMVRALNNPNVQLTNVDYSLSEAEQFLKDNEVKNALS